MPITTTTGRLKDVWRVGLMTNSLQFATRGTSASSKFVDVV